MLFFMICYVLNLRYFVICEFQDMPFLSHAICLGSGSFYVKIFQCLCYSFRLCYFYVMFFRSYILGDVIFLVMLFLLRYVMFQVCYCSCYVNSFSYDFLLVMILLFGDIVFFRLCFCAMLRVHVTLQFRLCYYCLVMLFFWLRLFKGYAIFRLRYFAAVFVFTLCVFFRLCYVFV